MISEIPLSIQNGSRLFLNENAEEIIVPNGTMGQRWEEDKKWNLILEREDGTQIDPALSILEHMRENGGKSFFRILIMIKMVFLQERSRLNPFN